MSSLEEGLYDLGRLDQLAYQDTPVHRLDPRAKVVTVLVFIVCVVSFGKYDLLAMVPFLIYPIFTAAEGNLPFDFLARKLLIAAPFAFFVGVFNPMLDTTTVLQIGTVSISGGWVSFAAIMFRFLLTISAALVLIGTTSFMGVCMGLERLGMPDVLATQMLFLYRYIFVLGEETMRMSRARASRSFGKRGMGMRVYSQILGHLLLRTYARAQHVYQAMLARGFDGHVRILRTLDFGMRDGLYIAGWSAAFVIFRAYNIPLLIGELVTGLIS